MTRMRDLLRRVWRSGTRAYGWMWALCPYAAVWPDDGPSDPDGTGRRAGCGNRTATDGGPV